jgi:hypothetical protein
MVTVVNCSANLQTMVETASPVGDMQRVGNSLRAKSRTAKIYGQKTTGELVHENADKKERLSSSKSVSKSVSNGSVRPPSLGALGVRA